MNRGDESPDEVALPPGLEVVRTTKVFDKVTVPNGLLRAHALDQDVWACLVVEVGTVEFLFEDMPAARRRLGAGERQVVPPVRRHRITPDGTARFFLEFHRPPGASD